MRPINRRWTVEDDLRLRFMIDANTSIHLIAAKLNRSTESVKSRASVLKVSLKRAPPRTQGGAPDFPRFLVRRGASRSWMVWDRQTKGPAKYLDSPAIGLAEEHAREIAGELTRNYIAKG
jgi:hypothetical protein